MLNGDDIESLSLVAISVTMAGAAVALIGATCTCLKIRSQRSGDKARAAAFETVANALQFVAVLVVLSGASLAYSKVSADRNARAKARRDKERVDSVATSAASAAASAAALAEDVSRAQRQRALSPDDVTEILKEMSFPVPLQNMRGTRIELVVSDRDPEAFRFALTLGTMLMYDARWTVSSSCGNLMGDVHNLIMEIRPELTGLWKSKPDAGPHTLPREANIAAAAWSLAWAMRRVRPDLPISERPWSKLSFDGEPYPIGGLLAPTEPDAGKQPEPMIRLIVGSNGHFRIAHSADMFPPAATPAK